MIVTLVLLLLLAFGDCEPLAHIVCCPSLAELQAIGTYLSGPSHSDINYEIRLTCWLEYADCADTPSWMEQQCEWKVKAFDHELYDFCGEYWGQDPPEPELTCPASHGIGSYGTISYFDVDRDGDVDLRDFAEHQISFGR